MIAENATLKPLDWGDPFTFIRACWPDMRLYEKQRDIIESVRDNLQTFVHAANEMGKTRAAALVAIWWHATRSPSRVILFSSSQDQLNQALWPELKSLIATSRVAFPWRIVEHIITKYADDRRQEILPLDRLVAHVTTEVERFHGVHLPEDRPRILVVFDEASAIADEFIEAAESFAHRILVIGNPLSNTNFFYRGCKGGDLQNPSGSGLLRRVIHIDGDDSPNVQAGKIAASKGVQAPPPIIPGLMTLEWMQRRQSIWDEETVVRRLHGRFFEGMQSMLIPYDWLEHAMSPERWRAFQMTERSALAMGVDVAQGGRDKTVWTVVDRRGIIKQILSGDGDGVIIAERTLAMMHEHDLAPSQVAMDAGGGGSTIADMLRHGIRDRVTGSMENAPVRVVQFGERPGSDDSGRGKGKHKRTAWSDVDPTKAYCNRRAEMYGRLRAMLNPCQPEGMEPFLLGPDAWELRKELAPIPLLHDNEGRMRLPSKDDARASRAGETSVTKLVGHSPDRSDSLVLALHAMAYGRQKPKPINMGAIELNQDRMAEIQKKIAEGVASRMRAR
jgi:hypothetical protein